MDAKKFEELTKDCDNIIFDYGGVFVDIVHKDTIDAFEKLSGSGEAARLYSKHGQTELFSLLETGKIGVPEFVSGLKRELGMSCSDEEILAAWNQMLKAHPAERVEFLRGLSKRKRVFMLSNINQIHEKLLSDIVGNDPAISDFYTLFEKVYFSHKIGRRKPDAEAFDLVLEENRLEPCRTVFIDDTAGHVAAARKTGMKGIHLEPANCFILRVRDE